MSGTTPAIIFGIIMIIAVIVLLIKQYETRMVLIGAGFLMAIVAFKPLGAFTAFSDNMVVTALILNICSALGFAAVLQLTQCDKHLVFAMAKGLKYIRPLLVPAVALATFLINIAIPSAAGCAAATGVIMIPLLISQGVHPATAASAIMLGTFGSNLSPGLSHNPVIAGLATDSLRELGTLTATQEFGNLDVIKTLLVPTLMSFAIGALCLTLIAKFRGEDKGYIDPNIGEAEKEATKNFKVNPFLSFLPLVPIVILLTFSFMGSHIDTLNKSISTLNIETTTLRSLVAGIDAPIKVFNENGEETDDSIPVSAEERAKRLEAAQITFTQLVIDNVSPEELEKAGNKGKTVEEIAASKMSFEETVSNLSFIDTWIWVKGFGVPHAMLLGAFLCLLFTRTNPATATKDFFNGMGKGYGDVIGIIIAAGVFVGGLKALGIITAGIEAMKGAESIAGIAATYGPYLLGVVSGSGDAAAMAFNKAVTAHATELGFQVSNMGSLAALAGSLGRTMSPIAGAAILVAGIAKVNPLEIAKRNALGMVLASIVAMIFLLYPHIVPGLTSVYSWLGVL